MDKTKKQEPKCEACGKVKSAHNILSQAATVGGQVRNGPYLDLTGQVFCHAYLEVR